MGEIWKEWGNVLGCGEVWEVCWGVGKYGEVWGMGSRCVEVCLRRGEMCLGCGERCGKSVRVGAT